MTNKIVSIKQIKEFFIIEEKMNNIIHDLLNLYLKKNDTAYLEACKNFEEFRYKVIQDLYYYFENDLNRNYDDFKTSLLTLEDYIKSFKNTYDLK